MAPSKAGISPANSMKIFTSRPSQSSGSVMSSGSNLWSRSIPLNAIRHQVNSRAAMVCAENPNRRLTRSESDAVNNSTSGYRIEMGWRQEEHFPRSNRYDITGIFSQGAMACPQCGQRDAGNTSPGASSARSADGVTFSSAQQSRRHSWCIRRGSRNMTTFRKLPTARPARKTPA